MDTVHHNDIYGASTTAAPAVSSSNLMSRSDIPAEQASTGYIDFDMSLFDEISPQQPGTVVGYMGVMDDAIFANQFDGLQRSMPLPVASPPESDMLLTSPELNAMYGASNGQTDSPESNISPWGSLPSEPKVMRTSKHRRVSSIGSNASIGGGDDKPSHRRSSSFHTFAGTSPDKIPEPQHAMRPAHRRGQSLGHALQVSVPSNSVPFLSPPIARQNSFPTATTRSPLSQQHITWLGNQQQQMANSAAHARTPPRASLPDISVPSNAPPNLRMQHVGHRRGYSIGTVPTESMSLMSHTLLSRDLTGAALDGGAQRNHSADSIPSNASRAAIHARQLAMGHRRGQSLGHAFINTPPSSQMFAPGQPNFKHQPFSPQNMASPLYNFSGMHASQYQRPIPQSRANHHARSLSVSSTASFLESPSINSANSANSSDMDPVVLETFVNMHLKKENGGINGGEIDANQIQAQELSILNDLNGEVFNFNMEEFSGPDAAGPRPNQLHLEKHDPQHMQQQMRQSQPPMQSLAANAACFPTMQSNTAAVAAEGLLPGNRTVKPEDDDEEEGSVSGEDEEEEEGEATEYRCQWTDCDHLFNSVDDLVSHVSELHIGAGKANYTCLWKGCTREQRPFTKRHKIHNHLRIHTGERPFQCPVADCGKKFSRQDGLNTHIKTHSNIKPYVCAIFNCGKAYYHSRSLRKHEKTHFVPTMMNINFLQQAGMMNPETFNTVWSNMAANGGAMPPPPSGMGFGGGLASNHDPAAYGQMQMQMQKMYFAQQAMQAGMGGYPSPMTYADAGMGGAAGAGGMGMNGWLDHHQPEQFGTIVGSNFNV